jgi:CheY-like chemotaxis protein/HPt (histidine-containing phosphotransfer) domain-containing protein
VVVAGSGRQALELWQREPFDLILLDVQMPEMDGFETARLIRQRERGTDRHTPILAMTAYAMKGDRERCLEAGMDDYVSKPIRVAELHAAIARLTPAGSSAEPHSTPASSSARLRELVDWESALCYVGGDEELLRDLTGTFLRECPRWRERVKAAIAAGDPAELHAAAHPFKNSLNTLGARRAGELLFQLETMGRGGDLTGSEKTQRELDMELTRLLPALEQFAGLPAQA